MHVEYTNPYCISSENAEGDELSGETRLLVLEWTISSFRCQGVRCGKDGVSLSIVRIVLCCEPWMLVTMLPDSLPRFSTKACRMRQPDNAI